MPPPFTKRVSVDNGEVVLETVYAGDSDAFDYWILDTRGHHFHALRRLPVVWNLALVLEGGLGEDLYEDFMTASLALRRATSAPSRPPGASLMGCAPLSRQISSATCSSSSAT